MQKLNNVSLLRVVAMICIFLCHVALMAPVMDSPYWYFPLHFGVQIFMFVSGYLYGRKNVKSYKDHIKQRFTVLLVPYYIFIFVLFTAYAIYNISLITLPTFIQGIFCVNILGHEGAININHFWYLFYALVSYVFIPWLIALRNHTQGVADLSKTKVFLIYALIVFLVLLELFVALFTLGQVAFTCLIVGFFFGAKRDKKESEQEKNDFRVLSWKRDKLKICLYALAFIVFSVIFYFTVSDRLYLSTIPVLDNLVTKYSTAIVGVTFSVLFLTAFKFMNSKKLIEPFPFLDGISYYFYITHQVFVVFNDVAYTSLIFITPYLWLNIIIAFAAALISAIILKLVSQPIINLIKNKLLNPKKITSEEK